MARASSVVSLVVVLLVLGLAVRVLEVPEEAEPTGAGVLAAEPAVDLVGVGLQPVEAEAQALQVAVPQPAAEAEATPTPAAGEDLFAAMQEHLVNARPSRNVGVLVVDSQGQPVPDASVEVWDSMETVGEPVERHVTDAGGACVLRGFQGRRAIVASKDGVGTSGRFDPGGPGEMLKTLAGLRMAKGLATDLQRRLGADSEIVLELRPTGRLKGRVLSARGTPLAGALIELDLGESPEYHEGCIPRIPHDRTSGADGTFDVEVDAPLWGHVSAVVNGRRTPPAIASLDGGDEQLVDLRFPGGFAIEGRVSYDAGPLPGDTTVTATLLYEGPSTAVDVDGRYRLELAAPDEYEVFAAATGLIESEPQRVTLNEAHPVARVDIRLVEAQTIRGKVTHADGTPATSVALYLHPEDASGRSMHYLIRPGKGMLVLFRLLDDGKFLIGPVSGDATYTLNCNGTRLRHVRGGARNVAIVLPEHHTRYTTLRGQVRSTATLEPVTRFKLDFPGHSQGNGWQESPSGRFEIEDLRVDEEWNLTIEAPGFAPYVCEPIMSSPEGAELDILMGQAGALDVSVVDDRGNPVAGAAVELLPVGWTGAYAAERALRAVTDQAGLAHFTDRPPGDHWIMAAEGERRAGPHRVAVPSGSLGSATIMVGSQPPGRIEVEVFESWQEVASGLSIIVGPSFVSEGMGLAIERQLPLDPARRAVFEDVPAGVCSVTARFSPDVETFRRVVLQPGATVIVRLPAP